jgi:integrase
MDETNSDEVIVHKVVPHGDGLKAGQYSLVRSPSMRLFEVPTAYLHQLAQTSPSRATWRNNAYALAYWLNYCTAAGVDWRYASVDDLIAFKNAMEVSISMRTGQNIAPGTIAQRMIPVIQFYADGETAGWYAGNISDEAGRTQQRHIPIDADPLAHTRQGNRVTHAASKLVPPPLPVGSAIRPFAIRELRALLEAIGPTATERDTDDLRPTRDRLIIDWGWVVGLRISEMLGLGVHQFLALTPDANAPWEQSAVEVLGKGNKPRSVSVPNWLIRDTVAFIDGERTACLKAGGTARRGTASALFVAGMSAPRPGRPIGPRRVQKMLEAACIGAGLVAHVRRADSATNAVCIVQRPLHHFHDLRHTYAVLTYHAEVRAGNSEPWKKIQAQLGHASLQVTINTYLKHVNGHNEFGSASVRDLAGLKRGSYGQ